MNTTAADGSEDDAWIEAEIQRQLDALTPQETDGLDDEQEQSYEVELYFHNFLLHEYLSHIYGLKKETKSRAKDHYGGTNGYQKTCKIFHGYCNFNLVSCVRLA